MTHAQSDEWSVMIGLKHQTSNQLSMCLAMKTCVISLRTAFHLIGGMSYKWLGSIFWWFFFLDEFVSFSLLTASLVNVNVVIDPLLSHVTRNNYLMSGSFLWLVKWYSVQNQVKFTYICLCNSVSILFHIYMICT